MKSAQNISRASGAGIHMKAHLDCPSLNDEALEMMDDSETTIITRHLKKNDLVYAREGSFRFGTLVEYKPADTRLIEPGRFGDAQESNYWKAVNAQEGFVDTVNMPGLNLYGAKMGQNGNDIVVETVANAFCSCSSIGPFRLERAREFRQRGNRDLEHYVSYDLRQLKAALKTILSEKKELASLKLFSQPVNYDTKDESWDIGRHFVEPRHRDGLQKFQRIAFIKSPDYRHEEELRILIIDPSRPGALSSSVKELILKDARIRDTIIDSGQF